MKATVFFAAVAVFLGVQSVASAAYSPILTVNAPANGTFPTYNRIKTSKLKVEKQGQGCPSTRMNYTLYGRDLVGNVIILTTESLGQTSSGANVYKVYPTATIFDFAITTVQYQGGDCVYTFSAHVLDDQE